jgi:hypothetical protein
MSPGFRHDLYGIILFINISKFYIAMSFMAIAILAIVMGNKLNIVVT